MKRIHVKLMGGMLVLGMAVALTGCVRAPVVPPTGMVYTQIGAPLDINHADTDVSGLKQGTSQSTSILGLIATGDASTQAAAAQGGLTTIEYADYEYFNLLGIIQRYSTRVYGQ